MGIINKIFSSVNGLYNNINPITLSGVNDVIVVRNRSGALCCSPFQLRFSRLNFYNSRAKAVQLYVNGALTEICMTITSQGDLFFEQQRAGDEMDYERVVEYLQSNEVSISGILSRKLTLGRRDVATVPAAAERLIRAHDDADIDFENMAVEDDAGEPEDIFVQKRRIENLNKRIFVKNNRIRYYDEIYAPLVLTYNKIGALLSSAEHYACLLDRQKLVLYLLESLISNRPPERGGAILSFSVCLNSKIERSLDETFAAYLTKGIDDPDNTVVRIEAVLNDRRGAFCADAGGSAELSRTSSLDDLCLNPATAVAAPTRTARVYMPFKTFTKLFFELRQSRNRMGKLVEFLEKEHNSALGWNLFGSKQPIKNDIGFSLELNSEELAMLNLHEGKNDVVFKISGQQRQLEGNIYLWNASDKIIVSDIDGTITKSDLLGHLYSMVGRDWTHTGVAALFTRVAKNGYRILYLTSRPLGQSSITRSYLRAVVQDSFRLPDGPVLHSTDGVFGAIYREVIIKRPEEFKIRCLTVIKELFGGLNPFLAGFGNRVSDAYTYKALGIPNNRIYTINTDGQLLAEYTQSLVGTYHTMNEFIDSIFPSLHEAKDDGAGHTYSDFAWWR